MHNNQAINIKKLIMSIWLIYKKIIIKQLVSRINHANFIIKLFILSFTTINYYVLFIWALLNIAKHVQWSNDHISPRVLSLFIWTCIPISSILGNTIVTYMNTISWHFIINYMDKCQHSIITYMDGC